MFFPRSQAACYIFETTASCNRVSAQMGPTGDQKGLFMFWFIPAFFLTALLYASVGFGGGSTYTALLALGGIDAKILPAISLMCNIVVVSGGTIRFSRAGLLDWRRALPLALVAAPFAFLGGYTPIKEKTFLTLLAVSLIFAGLALLLQKEREEGSVTGLPSGPFARFALPFSAAIGYLAGLVGIGGGIFLAPYLHLTTWAKAKQIAATASLFILINSVAGLVGQSIKLAKAGQVPDLVQHWPLIVSVLVGGQLGSMLGIRLLSPRLVRVMTGVLTLYVAVQLLWKLYF